MAVVKRQCACCHYYHLYNPCRYHRRHHHYHCEKSILDAMDQEQSSRTFACLWKMCGQNGVLDHSLHMRDQRGHILYIEVSRDRTVE